MIGFIVCMKYEPRIVIGQRGLLTSSWPSGYATLPPTLECTGSIPRHGVTMKVCTVLLQFILDGKLYYHMLFTQFVLYYAQLLLPLTRDC